MKQPRDPMDRRVDGDSVPTPADMREARDDDRVELPRESCPTADGEYGVEWWLAVHTARHRGHRPQALHVGGEGLFGDPIPCSCDADTDGHAAHSHGHEDGEGGRCDYSEAWRTASDPDRPHDVLIGHYTLAHVPTARTFAERTDDGVERHPRVLALNEFPGQAFQEDFGEEWRDHATWLGESLHDGVADHADLAEQSLWSDDTVRAWLDGDAAPDHAALAGHLFVLRVLAEARATALGVLGGRRRPPRQTGIDAFEAVCELNGVVTRQALADARETFEAGYRDSEYVRDALEDNCQTVREAFDTVYDCLELHDAASLAELTDHFREAASEHLGGDLAAVVNEAVAAHRDGDPRDAVGLLDTAVRALRGGRDGVEQLALWSDDGRAHPLAHMLLAGAAAPRDATESTVVSCDAFGWTDGCTRVQRVQIGTDTVLVDRDGHGATVSHPPSLDSDGDGACSVVGLDATARRRLWSLCLGRDVTVRDVHDSQRDRAAFIRDVYGIEVVQTEHRDALYYEGDPSSIDLNGPAALLAEIQYLTKPIS